MAFCNRRTASAGGCCCMCIPRGGRIAIHTMDTARPGQIPSPVDGSLVVSSRSLNQPVMSGERELLNLAIKQMVLLMPGRDPLAVNLAGGCNLFDVLGPAP